VVFLGAGGTLACGAVEAERGAPSAGFAADTTPESTAQQLTQKEKLRTRVEYCGEAVALKIRESWRDTSRNFTAAGKLRRPNQTFFYPVHRGLSRACDQLLRDEHGDFQKLPDSDETKTFAELVEESSRSRARTEAQPPGSPARHLYTQATEHNLLHTLFLPFSSGPVSSVDIVGLYINVQDTVNLANLYAEDARRLHDLAQAGVLDAASQREAESIFAHMNALYTELLRLERELQWNSYVLQDKNLKALLSQLEERGDKVHLQQRKVELVIALRRLRQCYVAPAEELDCESSVDAVIIAFAAWSTPPERVDSLEFDRQREQIFWRAAFEEDAKALISLLKKRPPKVTNESGALGLVINARVNLAVGRLLRDANTLAFDFP
jgi:hypothetical protein